MIGSKHRWGKDLTLIFANWREFLLMFVIGNLRVYFGLDALQSGTGSSSWPSPHSKTLARGVDIPLDFYLSCWTKTNCVV